jgi:hypothetical protein
MSFGPYTLIQVKVEGGALVLDLADETGEIVFRPRRLRSYFGHDQIHAKAKKLEGKKVITTTSDSRRNSPKFWWIDLDEYFEKSAIFSPEPIVKAIDSKLDHQVTLPRSTTTASEDKLADLVKKFSK